MLNEKEETTICSISELINTGIKLPFMDRTIIDSDPIFFKLLAIDKEKIIDTSEILVYDQYSDLFNPRFIISQGSILGFYIAFPDHEIHERELYSLSKWLPLAKDIKSFIFQARQLKDRKDLIIPDNNLYLSRICVRQSARGLGLGSLMLQDLHFYARQNNYKGIALHVTSNNMLAQKLYARQGYSFTPTSTHNLKTSYDRYLAMERTIK